MARDTGQKQPLVGPAAVAVEPDVGTDRRPVHSRSEMSDTLRIVADRELSMKNGLREITILGRS